MHANTTVSTLWIAFLVVEVCHLFNDHIGALHDGAHEGVHLELKNNEVGALVGGDHLLWKFNLYGLVSDFPTAREEVALHSNGRDWEIRLGIVTDFYCTVALLGNSLGSPLNVVL